MSRKHSIGHVAVAVALLGFTLTLATSADAKVISTAGLVQTNAGGGASYYTNGAGSSATTSFNWNTGTTTGSFTTGGTTAGASTTTIGQ
jgi:hypothetical protein